MVSSCNLFATDSLTTQLSHSHPGDVIHVSGVHTGKFVTSVDGTAAAPITIEGDGTAVLIGSSPSDPVLEIRNSFYRINNLAIRGGQKGIYVGGAHGILDGISVSDTQEEGFTFPRSDAQYWLVKNCSVRHTGLEGKYGEGFYVGESSGNWLTNRPDTPNHITFYNCVASDTVNDAWDFKEGAHHIKVVKCTADMTNSAPLPASSLPYDHTGAYCRANKVQYIDFRVKNLSEGAELDALGLYQENARDGVTYGRDMELKHVVCENSPKCHFVFINDRKMGVKIYNDCDWRGAGGFASPQSSDTTIVPTGEFVEMRWDGEGGENYGNGADK